MRKKIIAGNWKMNNNKIETIELINQLRLFTFSAQQRVMIAPSFTHLEQAVDLVKGSRIEIVAQNMNSSESGAFTGEISAGMLQSVGVNKVILGHSERRAYYNESDHSLKFKVMRALDYDMEIIFCFGEELSQRKNKNHFDLVKSQLSNALFDLEEKLWLNIILAYEPVWAIGTGETASPEQVQEMHAYIRNLLNEKYDASIANSVPIIYGGSVKPSNASSIFAQPDVDGGLIGGSSLKADDFSVIIQST